MAGQTHMAIVLAAGRGSRMRADTPKQFLDLAGKPLLYYSLRVFEESFVDGIILVTGRGQEEYCREEIIGRYGFSKVRQIIPGGKERCDSTYAALCAMDPCSYVYIHDVARPFIDREMLGRARRCVEEWKACAAGVQARDTIKIADGSGFVKSTPERRMVWQVQTPQAFSYPLIKKAYDSLFSQGDKGGITDDAMVVERMLSCPVKLFFGGYRNIKITTPEDIQIAEQTIQRLVIF